MWLQFSSMSARRGYWEVSTPKRCAAYNCGTRQQSAIVGVSPWQNLPGEVIALEMRIEGIESARDPLAHPCRYGGLVELELFLEIARGARVLQWLNVAGDDVRQHPHARAIDRVARNQTMVGKHLVEVLDDRERLREPLAVVHQCRHAALRIHRLVRHRPLVAAVLHEVHARAYRTAAISD